MNIEHEAQMALLKSRQDEAVLIRDQHAEIDRLRAENEKLRAALTRARDDINDYGLDDFEETTHETLAVIDAALASTPGQGAR